MDERIKEDFRNNISYPNECAVNGAYCTLWTGYYIEKRGKRRGMFTFFYRGKNRPITASRMAYCLDKGVHPDRLDTKEHVKHLCEWLNPKSGLCVTPSHLELSSHRDNMKDRAESNKRYGHLSTADLAEVHYLRHNEGWTQREIAEYKGVTQPHISRVLKGYKMDERHEIREAYLACPTCTP